MSSLDFRSPSFLEKLGLEAEAEPMEGTAPGHPRIAIWPCGCMQSVGIFSFCWQLSQCWGLVEIWWSWGLVLRCKVNWKGDNSNDRLLQQPSSTANYVFITSFTWNLPWNRVNCCLRFPGSPCREFNLPPWPWNPGQRWQRDTLCRYGTWMMPNATGFKRMIQ